MVKSIYNQRNEGDYPQEISFFSYLYQKVDNLRYGTNPHQTATFYTLKNTLSPIGQLKILKNGKNGLSQTNLEDISGALNICKYFQFPVAVVMKHVNPSGFATASSMLTAYKNARDADSRAAFGSVIAFNQEVDSELATEIMQSFVEGVVAPSFTKEAINIFNKGKEFKRNLHIRIIQCGNLDLLPKYCGEEKPYHSSTKTLIDGSMIIAQPLLTSLKSIDDLKLAEATDKEGIVTQSTVIATKQQQSDLLIAWYANISVRSNGIIIVKNGQSLSIGTGEQDRVGAIEQAIIKFNTKYEGEEELQGAVMSSDGFFPFPDSIEIAAKAGITAIISPAGSIRDKDVIATANNLGIALYFTDERIFSHH